MPGNTILILGAGFSKPAGGPLLRELINEDFISISDADTNALEVIQDIFSTRSSGNPSYTVEDLFTEIWREAGTAGSINALDNDWDAIKLLKELSIHLSSICRNIRIRRNTNLWHGYVDFLSNLFDDSKSLSILTFNYDLLIEQLLDGAGISFNYGSGPDIEFDNATRRRSLKRSGVGVSIFKLHGSANWGICRGCQKARRSNDLITAFERPYVPTRRKSCPYCDNNYLESGIIPPINGKAGETRHIADLWKQTRRKLNRAREIIIIGYSLPKTDLEAISLLKEIERERKRPRITIICGPRGAPKIYNDLFKKFNDEQCYFEEFLDL